MYQCTVLSFFCGFKELVILVIFEYLSVQETNSISYIYTRVCAIGCHGQCTFICSNNPCCLCHPYWLPSVPDLLLYQVHEKLILRPGHGDVALPRVWVMQWGWGSTCPLPLLLSRATVPASSTMHQIEQDDELLCSSLCMVSGQRKVVVVLVPRKKG